MPAKRILVVYYSQTGDVAEIMTRFIEPIRRLPDVDVTVQCLQPVEPYPFPWGSLTRLASVFPECHRGGGKGIRPLSIGRGDSFDLVILAYQVWFLAPSLPIQDFFKSEYSEVLRGARVITLCVNRNMWHSGSEAMKQLLRDAGALHLDNVVVTHQGPPFATFISVPRFLLSGKRESLWGIFPPAELGQQDLDRAQRLGTAVADQLRGQNDRPTQPLLSGKGAVHVVRRTIVPELLAWYAYQASASFVLFAGRAGQWARQLAIRLFLLVLLLAIFVGVPFMLLGTLVFYPFVFRSIRRYAIRLSEPSGEA